MSDILQTVTAIVERLAPAAEAKATLDSRLIEDLGYHSLALLELAFTLEDELEIEPIQPADAQHMTTVGDIADYCLKKLS